ncbi:MAG: M56 family metallopeptidase [Solirubrobacteraceae bacterium]
MSRARRNDRLQTTLGVASGLLALAALAALAVTARATVLRSPSFSATSLLISCRSWLMLDENPWHGLVLGLDVLGLAVMWRGVRSALGAFRSTRRFRRSLRPCGELAAPPAQVIDDPVPLAFCAGLLRPRVYLSTGALARLDRAELRAVLAHEAHHVKQRDPLRLLIARTLSDALFFLPVMRQMLWRHTVLAEIDADCAAVRVSGDTRPLASAMLTLGEVESSLVIGVGNERVDHLAGKPLGWRAPLSPLLGVAVMLIGVGALVLAPARAAGFFEISAPALIMQSCGPLMLVGTTLVSLSAIRFVQKRSRAIQLR